MIRRIGVQNDLGRVHAVLAVQDYVNRLMRS